MKKYILILLYLSYFIQTHGQFITGTVFDAQTMETLPFASVYYDQTFQGTVADHDGIFKLEISEDNTIPLIVSAIGYYSATITNIYNNGDVKIYLNPKVYKLNEVIISAKSLERKRKSYLKIFRREFIGTTANSKKCFILNESDITFNYDNGSDTLKAFALKPIQIENKALGYTITYYLDKFEYCKGSYTTFMGNFIFNEDYTDNKALAKTLNRKREYAYFGSRMHLIRTLYLDTIDDSGFLFTNQNNEKMLYSDFVFISDNNQRFLKNVGELNIDYTSNFSTIVFTGDSIAINETGFFNPVGIYWTGYMGLQRMADWLPYEYFPKE